MVVPIEPYQAVPLSVILAQILRSKDLQKFRIVYFGKLLRKDFGKIMS